MLVVCAVAAAAIHASMAIPPAVYERIGSGAFPMALGVLALGLVGLKALSFLMAGGAQEEVESEAGPATAHSAAKAFGALALITAYFATFALPAVPFTLATSAFTFLMFVFLTGERRIPVLAAALISSVLFAFLVHYVFTSFFYVDI
jgi:hypothetical protein